VTKTGLSLGVGTTYYFSIKAENGAGLQSGPTTSNGQYVAATSTPPAAPTPQPKPAEGIRAYPNPSSISSGLVTFSISPAAGGEIGIYTVSGRLVKTLPAALGTATVTWNGTNTGGEKVKPGLYIYRTLDNSGNALTGKLVLNK